MTSSPRFHKWDNQLVPFSAAVASLCSEEPCTIYVFNEHTYFYPAKYAGSQKVFHFANLNSTRPTENMYMYVSGHIGATSLYWDTLSLHSDK